MTQPALLMLFLVPLLAVISYVDAREMRIPDIANALLFAGGIVFWAMRDAGALPIQLVASVSAFALLWAVRAVHRRVAGRTGLGLGDVKMIAAAAIWFHPSLFPLFLLTATAAATLGVIAFHHRSGAALTALRVPFAPFISLGLLVTLFLEITAS